MQFRAGLEDKRLRAMGGGEGDAPNVDWDAEDDRARKAQAKGAKPGADGSDSGSGSEAEGQRGEDWDKDWDEDELQLLAQLEEGLRKLQQGAPTPAAAPSPPAA